MNLVHSKQISSIILVCFLQGLSVAGISIYTLPYSRDLTTGEYAARRNKKAAGFRVSRFGDGCKSLSDEGSEYLMTTSLPQTYTTMASSQLQVQTLLLGTWTLWVKKAKERFFIGRVGPRRFQLEPDVSAP